MRDLSVLGMDGYLKDGDTLTLRYTLAYGWDVGNGQGRLRQLVGYCVTYERRAAGRFRTTI